MLRFSIYNSTKNQLVVNANKPWSEIPIIVQIMHRYKWDKTDEIFILAKGVAMKIIFLPNCITYVSCDRPIIKLITCVLLGFNDSSISTNHIPFWNTEICQICRYEFSNNNLHDRKKFKVDNY